MLCVEYPLDDLLAVDLDIDHPIWSSGGTKPRALATSIKDTILGRIAGRSMEKGSKRPQRRTRLSRKDVIQAYQLILGRKPENEAAINSHMHFCNLPALGRALLKSEEFRFGSNLPRVEQAGSRQGLTPDHVIAGYELVLGRKPESRAALQGHLGHGDLRSLGRALIASEEFRWYSKDFLPLWPKSKWVCTIIRGGQRLWIDLHDSYVSFGCLVDDYEPSETKFILGHLRAGDTFIDIGANVGWFTILAAAAVGERGRVIAFEPRSEIFSMLARSVEDNGFGQRCELHRAAVGDVAGAARLCWAENTVNPGGSCIMQDGGGEGRMSEPVSMVRLDDLQITSPVRIIKMDIEGAEPLAVAGARRLLEREHPIIVSEIHEGQLCATTGTTVDAYVATLRNLGYRIFELEAGEPTAEIRDTARLGRGNPFNVVLLHDDDYVVRVPSLGP